MLASKEKLIGNHRYTVTQLGSQDARTLLVRLVRMLGPVFGALLDTPGELEAMAPIKKLSSLDSRAIANLISRFSDRIKPEDFDYLVSTLGKCSTVRMPNGEDMPLDLETQEVHFSGGNLMQLFRWVTFALEVQYGDFFPEPGAQKKDVAVSEVKAT